MGVVVDRNPGDPIVFHLNVSSINDSFITQPPGYPKIRISHSLDGTTYVEDLAEVAMTAVPAKPGEYMYKWVIPSSSASYQYKVQYRAQDPDTLVDFFDFDEVNVAGASPTSPDPYVRFG